MKKQSLQQFEEGITLEDIREVLIEAGAHAKYVTVGNF